MKHILDNFVISDVRLTTGKICLEIVMGQYGGQTKRLADVSPNRAFIHMSPDG